MPRQASIKFGDDDSEKKIHKVVGENGLTREAALGFIDRIDECEAKIEEIMQRAQEECQPLRDDIKAIKKEAAEQSFTKKAFGAKLRQIKFINKARTVGKSLNEREREIFETISALIPSIDEAIPQGDVLGR